jgi:hypothetical protein
MPGTIVARMRLFMFCAVISCCACHGAPGKSGGGPDGGNGGHAAARPGFAAAWQINDPAELVGGPSSAGRTGDWELANSHIRVVVEGAHASDGYDPYGCSVLAADRQRAAGESGESRFGEIWTGFNFRAPGCDSLTLVNDGQDGEPAQLHAEGHDEESPFMASLFAANAQPAPLHATIFRDYFLAPESDALQLNVSVRNDSADDLFLYAPYVGLAMNRGLRHWVDHSGFDFDFNDLQRVNTSAEYYAAVGEKVSYSFYNLESPFSPIVNFAHVLIGQYPQIHIPAGQAKTFRYLIGVGTGDTGSLQVAHAGLRALSALAPLSGRVVDAAGKPVALARVHVTTPAGDQAIAFARSAADGTWTAPVRAGTYALRAVADDRPPSPQTPIAVPSSGLTGLSLQLGAQSRIDAVATAADNTPIPAKIVFEPVSTPRPQHAAALGEAAPREPIVVFTTDGRASAAVYPGTWQVTFSRGFEYDRPVVPNVVAPAGGVAPAAAQLGRVVKTDGWMSGDFHVHAQYSADGDDLLAEKVRAFAAEGVELPVSTEHEYIGDFGPTVRALGLTAFMHPMAGTELTTTGSGHFNIFPLTPRPEALNHGAFHWYGRTIPSVLDDARARLTPDGALPLVQMNHPRTTLMGYLDWIRFDPDSFQAQSATQDFSRQWDAMEIWNGVPLEKFEGCPAPVSPSTCSAPAHPTAFDWFAFLDRRLLVAGTGNSDSHRASLRAVGYPRTYVRVGSDDPAGVGDLQILQAVRAQAVVISGGPFLLTSVGGVGPGGTATGVNSATPGAPPTVPLHLELQAPTWMGKLSRVDIWRGDKSPQGGALVKAIDLTAGKYADSGQNVVRLSATFDIPLPDGDTWLIATARGPVDPTTGLSHALWPVVESPLPPFAITNPIWIDANGDGKLTPLRQ